MPLMLILRRYGALLRYALLLRRHDGAGCAVLLFVAARLWRALIIYLLMLRLPLSAFFMSSPPVAFRTAVAPYFECHHAVTFISCRCHATTEFLLCADAYPHAEKVVCMAGMALLRRHQLFRRRHSAYAAALDADAFAIRHDYFLL